MVCLDSGVSAGRLTYVLIEALPQTDLANSTTCSLRLKLLTIGTAISLRVRRVKVAMRSAFLNEAIFDPLQALSAAAR